MRKISPGCNLYGDNFSPAKVEAKSNIVLSDKNEVGDLGKIGKYRNKKKPYGAATVYPEENFNGETESVEGEFLDLLKENLPIFKEAGADDIVLHYNVAYMHQSDLEFHNDIVKKIADLGIAFTITCYEDSTQFNEEENKN